MRFTLQTLATCAATLVLLVSVTTAGAQIGTMASSRFEVASIRSSPPNHGYTQISPYGQAQFSATNASLEFLIGLAFDVPHEQITGKPDWLDHEYFDLNAKLEGNGGLTYVQMKPMLQQLLTERFHLACHRETKTTSGYALVLAKGGLKLQPSTSAPQSGQITSSSIRSQGRDMGSLAAMLALVVKAPVSDKTGAAGNYDLQLKFAPMDGADSALPSLFTALQEQMGLKLESTKVSTEILVIDQVDRVPTEN